MTYLTELRQDIRYGLRMLARSPGFTTVALVSLSLGICIATCAYSEMNGLLRDLPGVRNPSQLVALQTPASFPNYKRYRELSDLFSATFAYVAPVPIGVSTGGRTERTWGTWLRRRTSQHSVSIRCWGASSRMIKNNRRS